MVSTLLIALLAFLFVIRACDSRSGTLLIEQPTPVLREHSIDPPSPKDVIATLSIGQRVRFVARGTEKDYMWWLVVLDDGRKGYVISGGVREID